MNERTKPRVTGGMRVKSYDVISRAVEEGIAFGWRRAHKHTDAPEPEAVKEAIETAVLGCVCDVFTFDNGDGND